VAQEVDQLLVEAAVVVEPRLDNLAGEQLEVQIQAALTEPEADRVVADLLVTRAVAALAQLFQERVGGIMAVAAAEVAIPLVPEALEQAVM
jgi:hypothetical protein